jgi:thioredoxin 1
VVALSDETEKEKVSLPTKKTASIDNIQTVTSSTFTPMVLNDDGPIAVEFMSYGCAHCRAIEPVLQHVASLLESQEKIFRVNTAVEHSLADTYAIRGTPTLIMFSKGKEVGRVEGPRPTESSVLKAVRQPFEP